MKKVEFSKKAKEQFEKILGNYPEKRAAMLPVLHLAEKEFGYISPEVEVYVGELLDVPPVKVREVLTFYTMFASKKRGEHHFQVCRGIACDLLGCTKIIEYLKEHLGVDVGATSDDFKVTLSEVECLGACETAPMMQLDDDYYGKLTPKAIDKICRKIEAKTSHG